MPYKRYATTEILPLARQYLEQAHLSLRNVVKDRVNGKCLPVFYAQDDEAIVAKTDVAKTDDVQPVDVQTDDAEANDQDAARALSHSTLWRWLVHVGAMTATPQLGIELFLQVEPSSTIHRFQGEVHPAKGRSTERRQRLADCRRLLYLQSRWDERFPQSPLFARFATACRSP